MEGGGRESYYHTMELARQNCEIVMYKKLARDAEARNKATEDTMFASDMKACWRYM